MVAALLSLSLVIPFYFSFFIIYLLTSEVGKTIDIRLDIYEAVALRCLNIFTFSSYHDYTVQQSFNYLDR